MDYEIGKPEMAWLLVLVPVVLLLIGFSGWKRRTALAKFGVQPTARSTIREWGSAMFLLGGISLLVLASIDIRWGKTTRTVPQKGLEVVFALDVSRSMLAEDARPNRLARAKQQIKDMVGEMAGDRIGLVVFAGEAKQAVPLTNHYNDFRQKLDSVGPETVAKGGSQLGVAIRSAADAFLSKTNDHKTVVLFTDGEDQESEPVALAKELFDESGMRIFTVGLGDMDKGARIPQDRKQLGQFVEHQGQQVWSKLNGSILRQIATETQAAYIPAGTKRVNMADVYHNYIANVEKSEFETARINAFIPRFQWFAFPALVCLMIHGWLSTMPIQKRSRTRVELRAEAGAMSASASATQLKTELESKSGAKVAATVAVMLLAFWPSVVNAQPAQPSLNQTVAQQINAANDLVRGENYQDAIEAFGQIETASQGERDALNYNLAIAHYENSDVEAARALFSESAKSENDRIAADSRYNLGNCHFAQALSLKGNASAAIEELEAAIAQYRSAIRLDRNHAHARENLERAVKLIKQLRDEESDQQDQEKDQGEDTEQEQKDDSNTESDSSQNDQSQDQEQGQDGDQGGSEQDSSSSDEDQGDSGSQTDDDRASEENASKNEDAQSESQENSDGQSEPDQNSSDQSTGGATQTEEQESSAGSETDNQQRSSAEQGNDSDQQKQVANESNGAQEGDPQESAPLEEDGKSPPQGEITAANQTEDQNGDEPQQSLVEVDSEDDGKTMSRQEALKLLQSARDRDMLRRYRQQQLQRNRRTPVEKDW